MYADSDSLRSQFEQLETDELLRLRSAGTLTDEAQVVLGEELSKRIDNVPPATQSLEGEPPPTTPTDEDAAEFRKIAKRFQLYFLYFPIFALAFLGIRGALWVLIAMFGGRMLAPHLVRWVFVSASSQTGRRILLSALAIGYPVLLWFYTYLLYLLQH
jgi:hypothetical protein